MTVIQQDAVVTWAETGPAALRGTLVVLPGRGESPDIYERFGRRLAADAYRVHAVASPTASPERALDQLLEVLTDSEPTVPRVVVGSDAGAAYAAHLAARSSRLHDVGALVLAGLPADFAPPATDEWDDELAARTACPTHRARISQGGVQPAQLYSDLPEEWLHPSTPGLIDVPVLGFHGQDDSVSPVDAARRWYANVPRAELVTIAGGRHDALNDQTHRTVAATIVLFLERLRLGADLAPIAITESS